MNARYSRRAFLKMLGAGAALALAPRFSRVRGADNLPLIVDAHLDIGWNAINFQRDYTQSAFDLRAQSAGKAVERVSGKAMVGLPELLQGHVGLIFATIYMMPKRMQTSALQRAVYNTVDEAEALGWQMADAIEMLAQRSPRYQMVRSQRDLDAVLATWAPDQPADKRTVGILMAMEGADPIRTPDQLGQWYERGVRCIGLSWGMTRYAGGNTEPGGLTALGKQLLAEMARYNVILDTAHLAEQAFWDITRVWPGRFVYTHGVPRRMMTGERALSDEQIKTLAERGGVMGIGLYNGFYPGKSVVTINDILHTIDYVVQLTGSADHVALGSDFDGGFGAESAPQGFNTIADLQLIPTGLASRGYSAAHIQQIMSGNWLQIVRDSLPKT